MGRMAGAAETWFPAAFHPENIKTIKENGDYFAPFEFDIIVGSPESWLNEKSGEIKESLLVTPRQIGYGIYSHGYLCPFTSFLRELHVWRDEKLIKEYDADANYYDISFSNVLMACFSNRHGHPIGGGKWMIEAWRKLAAETKESTSKAKGSYVPQGIEVIIEPLIGDLDFYQLEQMVLLVHQWRSTFGGNGLNKVKLKRYLCLTLYIMSMVQYAWMDGQKSRIRLEIYFIGWLEEQLYGEE